MPKNKSATGTGQQRYKLTTPVKIGGTIAMSVGLLICLSTAFVPNDIYPEVMKPLTEMKKEIAGISIASMVVALIILRARSENADSWSQIWSWFIATAGYVASIIGL